MCWEKKKKPDIRGERRGEETGQPELAATTTHLLIYYTTSCYLLPPP